MGTQETQQPTQTQIEAGQLAYYIVEHWQLETVVGIQKLLKTYALKTSEKEYFELAAEVGKRTKLIDEQNFLALLYQLWKSEDAFFKSFSEIVISTYFYQNLEINEHSHFNDWEDLTDSEEKQIKSFNKLILFIWDFERRYPGLILFSVAMYGVLDFTAFASCAYRLNKLYEDYKDSKKSWEEYWLARYNILRAEAAQSLQYFNLSKEQIERIWQTWWNCGHEPLATVFSNLSQLIALTLGTYDTVMVKTLVEKFGIENFNRYPITHLNQQFEQRHTPGRYVLAIYPKSDWNGALQSEQAKLEKLSQNLGEIPLRVIEAGSASELVVELGRLRKTYGAHTIAAVVISGHGKPSSIQLGNSGQPGSPRKSINLSMLFGNVLSRFSQYFTDSPTLVLNSCSTGQEEGIAQRIAQVLNATVIAPTVPTSLITVIPEIYEDKINLDAVYKDDGQKVIYRPKTSSAILPPA